MRKARYSKTDFRYEFLPKTRPEVFRDCYHNRFPLLFRAGITLLLSSLPLLVFSFLMDLVRLSVYSTSGDDAEALSSTLALHDLLTWVGFSLLFFVILLVLSGVLRLLRQLSWGEGIYYHDDLKQGLRQSYGMMALITGIMLVFFLAAVAFLCFFPDSLLSWAPLVLFLLFVFPVYLWMMLLINTYSSEFREYLKNAVFFYSRSIGFSLLFTLLLLLPFLLFLFTSESFVYFKSVIAALLVVFYYPAVLFAFVLYTNAKFDSYLNKDNYPEYYRKGLFDPEKEIRGKGKR